MITPVPPAYTIGKASSESLHKEIIPGPTDYDPYGSMRSSLPAYSFTRSPRQLHSIANVPGPGLYSPGIDQRGRGFTIAKSPRALSNIRHQSPGPGDYSYEVTQMRYKYSISKARNRHSSLAEYPGPGYYSPNLTVAIENSPRIKFQKQNRMPASSFLTPAPGFYNVPEVPKQSGYTFARAKPKIAPPSLPGPGYYSTPLSTIGIASMK